MYKEPPQLERVNQRPALQRGWTTDARTSNAHFIKYATFTGSMDFCTDILFDVHRDRGR